MKTVKMLMTFFLLLSMTIYAEEEIQTTSTITQLIQKIKHAPSKDKRILMNQLKVKLREMNQATRAKVMKELQQTFASQKGTQTSQQSSQLSGNSISSVQGTQQRKMQQISPGQHIPQRQITPTTVPVRQTPMRPTIPRNGQPRGPR